MKKSMSYKVQGGCWNCKHVFCNVQPDEEPLYCTFKASKRPKCGSVFIDGEEFDAGIDGDCTTLLCKWNNWATGKLVHPAGKCENWKVVDN